MISDDLLSCFRQAFLRHRPDRHALMLPPGQRQKYTDQPGEITDDQLRAHLAGTLTLAAPAAHAGLSCLLVFDVDAGGLAALVALLAAAESCGFAAFAQYTPRATWDVDTQRGYVWLVFNQLVNAERLQLLGQLLIADAGLGHLKIERRAHNGDTRLPLGKHTHTNRFGSLIFQDGTEISIDADPPAALQALQAAYYENPVTTLPELPELLAPLPSPTGIGSMQDRDVIRWYNQHTDIRALTIHYTGKRHSYTLHHCCCGQHANGDTHPSLGICPAKNPRYGAFVVKGFSPDCAFYRATDAFGVYCHMENLTPKEAVKKLAQEWGLDRTAPDQVARPRESSPAPAEDGRRRPQLPPITPPQPAPDLAERIRKGVLIRFGLDLTMRRSDRKVFTFLHAEAARHQSSWCRPSQPRIAAATGLAERTVQISLGRLKQEGYITIQRNGNSHHGGDETNIYLIGTTADQQGGGRSPRSPKVSLDHDSQLEHDLKPGRGGNPVQPAAAHAQPSGDPEAKNAATEPPKAAPLPNPPIQPKTPAKRVKKPQGLLPKSPAMSWLYDLGSDMSRLEEAEATARTEAKFYFAKKRTTAGRRRMWEANQLKARIAQLKLLPQYDDHAPAPGQATPEALAQEARLLDLGIYPDNARRYRDLPPATIKRAEALARSVNGDLPRLMVAFLKRHVAEGWEIPAPAGQEAPLDLEKYRGAGEYAAFFSHDEALIEVTDVAPDRPGERPTSVRSVQLMNEEPDVPATRPLPAQSTVTQLPAPGTEPPDWIACERWQVVSGVLRGILAQSRLVDGQVQAATAWSQKQVCRYEAEIHQLVVEAMTQHGGTGQGV